MPERPLWTWDDKAQRYRETASGRFIGIERMNELRGQFISQQKNVLESLTDSYYNGSLTLQKYHKQTREIIKDTYIDLYAMGAGGRKNLSARDWGRIGAMLKEQYKYLDNLMAQIERGEISPAQAAARLNMYLNSANEALWKAYTRDLCFALPAYPGDGSTQCLTNCQCEWEIVKVPEGVDCYWRLGAAEHCPDCVERSVTWNPWKWPESRNNV